MCSHRHFFLLDLFEKIKALQRLKIITKLFFTVYAVICYKPVNDITVVFVFLHTVSLFVYLKFNMDKRLKRKTIKLFFSVCPVCAVCSEWLPDRYLCHMMLRVPWDQWLLEVLLALLGSTGCQPWEQ